MANRSLWVLMSLVMLSCAGGKMVLNTTGSAIQVEGGIDRAYTLYAVGDTGEDNEQSTAVIKQLATKAMQSSSPGVVLFLGDNLYPAGLPDTFDRPAYAESAALLTKQVEALSGYPGRIIFIPGNHDWNEFKPGGLDAIRREGEFLKRLGEGRVSMLPENGCGGPVALELTNDIVLLIVDSQWWIQAWEKEPLINTGCDIQSREEFKLAFHQKVGEHRDKQILVAIHHPLFSQGNHGGHFSVSDHLFPLTNVVDWLWLPLPVIGSIYPGYRSIIGHPQDLSHSKYKTLKAAILEELDYPGEMIFLSGHEHNLQYLSSGGNHFLISGSGAKQSAVANGKTLHYGHQSPGFLELSFFRDKSVQLTVYEVDPNKKEPEMVFRQMITGTLNR